MIIAETILYRRKSARVQRVRIAISAPEHDPVVDVRCRVAISGEPVHFSHGMDSFQALNLAFIYVRTVVAVWLKRKQKLYFDRKLKHRYDARFLILNDASFYEKLGLATQKKGVHV
jgi:hypothetical protein